MEDFFNNLELGECIFTGECSHNCYVRVIGGFVYCIDMSIRTNTLFISMSDFMKDVSILKGKKIVRIFCGQKLIMVDSDYILNKGQHEYDGDKVVAPIERESNAR